MKVLSIYWERLLTVSECVFTYELYISSCHFIIKSLFQFVEHFYVKYYIV